MSCKISSVFLGVVVLALNNSGSLSAAPVEWSVSSGGNGHWYEAVAVPGMNVSWTAAQTVAVAKGGYLACITSAAENDFVFGVINYDAFWNPEYYYEHKYGPWLGGYQYDKLAEPDGHWAWVSGESWDYTNWLAGEPNNSNNAEDFLHYFYYSLDNSRIPTWNDQAGQSTSYVIEYNTAPVSDPSPLRPTWNGVGADNNWSTPANWDAVALIEGATLTFSAAIRSAPNNDMAAGFDVGGMIFKGPIAFTLSGNAIDLWGDITNSSDQLETINLGINLQGVDHTVNTAPGDITTAGVLSGSGGLTKTGPGTLSLSASNTYSGTTTVSGGILRLGNTNALPGGLGATGGTSNLTINGGVVELGAGDFYRGLGTGPGEVQFTASGGFIARGADRIVNLGGSKGQVAWGSGGFLPDGATFILSLPTADRTIDFQNPIHLGDATRTVQVAKGAAAMDAKLSGELTGNGGLMKTGSGQLSLTVTNSYTGPTIISDGILRIESGSALPGGIGATGGTSNLVLSGGTLHVYNADFYRGLGTGPDQVQFMGSGGFSTSSSDVSQRRTVNLGGASAQVTWGQAGFVPNGAVLILSASGNLDFQNPIDLGNEIRTIQSNVIGVPSSSECMLSGAISGTGGILKTGDGILSLVGPCAYTGDTTIAAGTLKLGGSAASYAGNIVNNGTLVLNRSVDFTLPGNISGSGGLTTTGSGVVTLSGTNTYAGATVVSGGTLTVASAAALPVGTVLSVNSGAKLDMNGFDYSGASIRGTGTVALGGGTLRVNNASGGTLAVSINGSGGLIKTGAGQLSLTATNSYTGPTIISDGELRIGKSSALPGGIGVTGGTSNLVLNGGMLHVYDASFFRGLGTGPDQVQFTGSGGFCGSSAVSNQMWQVNLGGALAEVTWGQGGFVPDGAALMLSGFLAFSNPIDLGDEIRTIQCEVAGVSKNEDYLFGNVSGAGGILKTGDGTLTLYRPCTYTGDTTIAAGTLNLGGTFASYAGNIVNNGTLSLSGSVDLTLPGNISGSGGLTTGSRIVTLSGTNTYAGATVVSGGTLKLASAASLPVGTALSVNSGAKLDTNGFDCSTSTIAGAGTLILGGGTLTVNNAVDLTPTLSIVGPGRLIKAGKGTLVLATNYTFPGGITITGGTLQVGLGQPDFSDWSIGINNAPDTNQIARVDSFSQSQQAYAIVSFTDDVANFGNLSFFHYGDLTYSGNISGTGPVTINWTRVIMTGANTYSGATTVNGTLRLASPNALPGGIGATGGASNLILAGCVELATGDFLRGLGTGPSEVQFSGSYGGGGFVAYGANRVVNLGGAGAKVTWGSGGFASSTLNLSSQAANATLDFQNAMDLGTSYTACKIYVADGPTAVEAKLSGVISGGTNVAFVKDGGGTLELTAANTYSGITRVANGVLRLSNVNALPGGTGFGGGGSPLHLVSWNGGGDRGVLELAAGDFTRALGTGPGQVYLDQGAGCGFSAVGADRVVNLGGAGATIDWDNPNFVRSAPLILSSPHADATLDFQNPLNTSESGATFLVDDGAAAVDAKLSGSVSGSGVLSKSGTGTLLLAAVNTYSGPTYVSGGTLRIGVAGALPAGSPLRLSNGGVLELAAGDFFRPLGTGASQVQITSGGFSAAGGDRVVNLGGASAIVDWGNNTFFLSDLVLSSASADSTIDFQNPMNLGSTLHNVKVNNGSAMIDAKLSGALSGTGGLTKAGLGTLTLTGNNSYSGGTTITAGTLIVGHTNALGTTGAIANNGTLAIAAGVTFTRSVIWGNASVLAGSGIYKPDGALTVGATTAGNASALSPGIGSGNVGTLTIGNHLSLDGATLMWDAASATGYDAIAVQGNLTLSNTNTVAVLTAGNGTYDIMTYTGSLTGNASNLAASVPPGLCRAGTYDFDTNTAGIIKMIISGSNAGVNFNLIWNGSENSDWKAPSPRNWTGGDSMFYNGDTVTFDDSSTVGTVQLTKVSATVALQPASVTVNNNTTAYTFNGDPISGSGSLTKLGSGTLTVNTANTYSGDTIIRGGTLVVGVPRAIPFGAGFGNVVLDGGAMAGTLNLNGSSITINGLSGTSGAVRGRVINDGETAVLTVGGNNVTSSFAGNISDGAGSVSLVKIGSGTLTLTGNNSYTGPTTVSAGTVILSGDNIATSSLMTVNGGTLTLNSANALGGGAMLRGGTLNINNANAMPAATFTISGAGTIDNTSGAPLTLATNNPQAWNADFTFAGTQSLGLGSGLVTLGGDCTVSVNASTLTVGGNISGSNALTKAGVGALALAGDNTFTGGVTLSAGRLNINSPTALGATAGKFTISGVSTIDNTSGAPLTLSTNNPQAWNTDFVFAGTQDLNLGNGPVTFSGDRVVTVGASTLTVGGNMSGSYALTKAGVGAIALAGDNTFTGGVTLSAGRLNINSPTALGAATGKFTISGVSTIDNTSGAPLTLATNNPQAWNTDFVFVGTQDLNLGSGPVTFSGDRVVTVSASTLTVGGKISGSYALTKVGVGALALAGDNTFTGGVTLSAGRLNINSPTALGAATGTFTISGVTTIDNTSGAPLTLSANNPQAWNANFTFAGTQDLNLGRGPVTLGGNCVVTVSVNTLTVGGNITGAHSWAKAGVGTLTLTGDNTFTGGMVLSGGRLNINSPTALGAATGKFSIYGTSTIDNTSGAPLTLSNNPQAWNTSFTFVGTQDLNLGAGPVTLSGDRVVTVSASTLTVGGKISGSYALTKAGLGTLALTAANTYTGATTINAGKLLVNGSLASPVTVNGGGTLGGSGTITRLLTVNTAGTLAPGNSIGTLTLSGGLTLGSGAKLDFELGSTMASDLISMSTSTLILNNQQFSDFRFTSMDGFGMGVYTLIDAGSISGSLGTNTVGTINGLPATLSVSGNDLTLTVVPEPSAFALLGMGTLGLLGYAWRRRKA